jgi:hypothetical protein
MTTRNSRPLAETVDFSILGHDLGKDVEATLNSALRDGAIFDEACDSLVIFRKALNASIRSIELHPRGRLFQDFLSKGPYENVGEIPEEIIGQRLSDDETASAITFIYSHMVNCFKGAIAELLAVKPCLNLMEQLKRDGTLPDEARLYVGDAVRVHRAKGKGRLKGADLYIMIEECKLNAPASIVVGGVTEVKSYPTSESRLREQLYRHLKKAEQGLQVEGIDYPAYNIKVGYGKDRRVLRFAVVPSSWKLPRSFRYKPTDGCSVLHVDTGKPLRQDDEVTQTGDNDWRITLRWSKEALAEAAYEMTFWYMGKVGEIIYSKRVPKGWEKMKPSEAGRNSAKMMLYYAILRCRTIREEQRAIALYNAYGFGYALGMSYKNAEKRREMLWPQDLHEILTAGKIKNGCALLNFVARR